MKKYFFVIILLLFSVQWAWADRVFFKNGTSIEEEVHTDSKGVWVGGLLFKAEEVDHIEKTVAPEPAAPVVETKPKSWWDNMFSKPSETPAAKIEAQPVPEKKEKDWSEMIAEKLIPDKAAEPKPDVINQGTNYYKDRMDAYSTAVKQANDIQQKVHQQNIERMKAMREMEEGTYDEPVSTKSSKSSYHSSSNYSRDNSSYSTRSRKDTSDSEQKSKKNPLKQGFKFDENGEAKWE